MRCEKYSNRVHAACLLGAHGFTCFHPEPNQMHVQCSTLLYTSSGRSVEPRKSRTKAVYVTVMLTELSKIQADSRRFAQPR